MRSRLAVNCIYRTLELGDNRLFAALLNELQGSLYLWPHAARREMTFLYILLCFFYAYLTHLLLVGFAEVDGHFLHIRQYKQAVRLQLPGQQGSSYVLVYNGLDPMQHSFF